MIGDKIRYYRMKLGISQEELGYRIHRSTKFISDLELNKVVPAYYDLIELTQLFQISFNELMDDHNDEINNVFKLLSNLNHQEIIKFEKIIEIVLGIK